MNKDYKNFIERMASFEDEIELDNPEKDIGDRINSLDVSYKKQLASKLEQIRIKDLKRNS